ncbi:hypothetical protein LAC81_01085 [Ensifer adhaerens]|uniref:hypothetical protein n=1 Tax=Ensifer adhaerens TaxID=106592 RepID=UPI001CBE357B|nr:hypothetical protein [Ensifer adhaerens]MBZ7920380.1 hypothetical protein [Ensifer adhaerens]UAX94793.1 hypothetical protein LAC78_01085 [Ensifer adhaerens]UAY02425.1 hypothetical protein LAC80_01085 [Ensifer adhaerens]UAY09804.1 hypothetical protein LAC81_01085 [Ensifer adhaerens]
MQINDSDGGKNEPAPDESRSEGKVRRDKKKDTTEADLKKARLARNLRDNLQRRKQQARARRSGAADEVSGLPAAKTDESQD